jgi:hypothetical protein
MDVDHNRDKCRAFVKLVMNLLVPLNAEKFLSGCACQKGLFCVVLAVCYLPGCNTEHEHSAQ